MASQLERGKPHAANNVIQRNLYRLFPSRPIPATRHVAKSFWQTPIGSIFFSGSFNIVRTSVSRQLEIEDIDNIHQNDSSRVRAVKLKQYFEHYQKRKSKQPLLRALERSSRKEILFTGLCRLYRDLTELSHILMYFIFAVYLSHRNDNLDGWRYTFGAGVGLVAASTAIIMSISIADAHATSGISIVGANMKTSLDSLLLQKSFVISRLAQRKKRDGLESTEWSDGTVVSIMNTDTERIYNAANNLHFLWMPLLLVPLGIGLAYYLMGWSGVAGLVTMFAFYPFMWIGSNIMSKLRKKFNILMDLRNSFLIDSIQNIRFLKSFVWEDYFYNKVEQARLEECRQNYKIVTCQAFLLLITIAASRLPLIIGTLLFSVYGNDMSGSRVVAYFAMCAILSELGFYLTPAWAEAINAYLSIKRIEEYLLAEENIDKRVENFESSSAVSLVNAQCVWKMAQEVSGSELPMEKQKEQDFTLEPISFDIGPTELVAIVGPSGCGKSSLLSAITGDMHHESGSIFLKSSIAYCPQRAWIQNATVRDNIVFGLPFDQSKYDQIVYECALTKDMAQLPQGDLSVLGERGINLSGGQKHRIQLARTLYMDREIVIMDDPLSAVDAHTSKHLFENVIGGRLKDKCRILVTHQLQVLGHCDRIIFMENGKISAVDTYYNLLNNESFLDFLQDCKQNEEKEESENSETTLKGDSEDPSNDKDDKVYAIHDEEERALSSVSWRSYHNFIRISGSYGLFIPIILTCLLQQAFNVVVGLAYTWWADNKWGISNTANLGIAIGVTLGHLFIWTTFMILVMVFCIKGSRRTSMRALKTVLNAPVSFFNRNPMGRIINRFTVDVNQMDLEVPSVIWLFFQIFTALIVFLGTMIVYVHLVAAILLPWCILLMCLAYFYKASPREIKRLEALYNSNVSSQLSENYSGRESIKCSHQTNQVLDRLHETMDELNSLRRMFYRTVQWVTLRQDAISCVFYFITGILTIRLGDKIDPSIGALIMFYSGATIICIRYLIDIVTRLQKAMVSVERLQYYGDNINSEGIRRVEGFNENKAWPQNGSISLQDVNMRYHDGLPLTLHNVNLEIPGQSKVGVVGRTGAGKSSLFQVLLRMIEISSGKIFIDGVDISTAAGLHDVREQIAVIPQDPTLFEGTVRANLDPLGLKEDFILNAALKNASLANNVGFNLEKHIEAGGENLSNGQRQLMALARALVKDSKIIISDEATSSVDYETDSKIQQVMMDLSGKTVISIAHRIRTIIHYDYICVMSNGRVVDFDTPLNLFDKGGESIFRSMCDESKISRQDLMEKQ